MLQHKPRHTGGLDFQNHITSKDVATQTASHWGLGWFGQTCKTVFQIHYKIGVQNMLCCRTSPVLNMNMMMMMMNEKYDDKKYPMIHDVATLDIMGSTFFGGPT